MIRRIVAILKKETTQIWRDKVTLAISIAIPLTLLLLFGYSIKMNVRDIPTAVADQSRDDISREYINSLVNSQYFKVVEYLPDQVAVKNAIDDNQVQVGVIISPDFSEDVDKGDAKVMILVDGSDPFVSLSAYLNANIVAQQYSIDVLMQKVQQVTADTTAGIPLTAKVRILYNPDLNDIWFIIPGLIAVIMQTMAIALVVGAIVKEREVGTMEQILVTPIEPIELLIGKIIPNFVLLMGNLAMILFFSMVVFKVPFRGNILIFLLCVVVYLLACMGLGLLISTTAENQRQAFQVNIFILLVGLVVSGFIFPRSTLPRLLNWLGYLFPLTYFIPIARGIISKGIGLATLWPMVVELLVYSTVIIFISAKVFRQSID